MSAVSLKISIVEKNVVKTIVFDPNTTVYDACRIIREKNSELPLGQPKDYSLFLPDEDPKKGVWLEPIRNLGYYLLKSGDIVEYRRKLRTLKVRMLDGTVKTIMIDDAQPVANLMVVICTKIGITNHDEYSLVHENQDEEIENKPNYNTLTLGRRKNKEESKEIKDAKMEQLKKKLKTDDELNWLDLSKTLREQGIDENETVLLRRKYFFSDGNIDSTDPVQLNLLYVQARDAIIESTHPITQEQACEFAGIQCQVQFGNHNELKHKAGLFELKEFLPACYAKIKGIEKKIFSEHKNHGGISELDAKVLYTKTARGLSTYGVTFFLVKEKMKGKNKLVPRLLGINKESVLRLDEKTKIILKVWPLTTVRRWAASPNTFTLDFGDYSDEYYSVQTTEGEQISQLIAGYIDIILKKKKQKDHFGLEGDEGSTMVEDSVSPLKANFIQHQSGVSTHKKVDTQSVAKPAILRTDGQGPQAYGIGQMQGAQTTGEDSISPLKANFIQHHSGVSTHKKVDTQSVAKSAILRTGSQGPQAYGIGQMQGAQLPTIQGQVSVGHLASTEQSLRVTSLYSEPHRALISTISTGQEMISVAERELEQRAKIPELGKDAASTKWKRTAMDTNKQSVTSQIAAMNAATASVVQLTGGAPESVDHMAVGAAISTISSNLPEMAKGVKMIAALMDDDTEGDGLMDAARKLCGAFSDLLSTAEPENKEPRQNLLGAASRVGESSKMVLTAMGDEDAVDREIQDILLGLAKSVANTTAALVLQAKHVAASCPEQADQNRVIGAATQCALATSQLVAVAKVVSSTIGSPACQNHLIEAAREVARSVEGIVLECQQCSQNDKLMRDLHAAAGDVTGSLNDLLNHIKDGTRDRVRESVQESAVDSIMVASDRLFASSGDPAEMVKQARILAQATAQLIQAIKGEADNLSGDNHHNLLSAARLLAEATANLVETAKACASNPHDPNEQGRLRRAAEELRSVTLVAAGDAIRKKAIKKLETAAKQAASSATQCLAASQSSGQYNTNSTVHDHLITECQSVADVIPKVVQGVKATLGDPDSSVAQLNLINVSEEFAQVGQSLVLSSKGAIPTVSDSASAMQLSSTSKAFAQSLSELKSAASKAREACGPLELESALDTIALLSEELDEFQKAVDAFNLKPLPGDTAEAASQQLTGSTKAVGSSIAQLLTAATQGDAKYTGMAASSTASALRDLIQSARAVAATTEDRHTQYTVIESAQSTVGLAYKVIDESRSLLTDPNNMIMQQRLHELSKQVTHSLTSCVNSLPGQKDVDDTIRAIGEASRMLEEDVLPRSDKSYSELQNDLNAAASQLNEAVGHVAASAKETPAQLARSTKEYGMAFGSLVESGLNIASQTGDLETRGQMVTSIRTVSKTSITFLTSAKQYNADPTAPNAKNLLSNAARAVTEAINGLVDSCTSAAPGQKECDNAVRAIQAMRPLLDNPSQPVSDLTYFECLDTVMEKSKSLGEGMTGIANIAKKAEYEPFGEAVKGVSDSICGLVESAAQAAYLVGVSDPSSVAGKSGLVDQTTLFRASQAIQTACQQLANPSSSKQQVLSAATIIAKHTSSLCNSCRLASGRTTNPVAKRQFVRSATDVANATANLVKEIKNLDQDYTDRNQKVCAEATLPLIESVEGLVNFASSPEFASVPAKISSKAREAQEPITMAAKGIIDGSCSMIYSAKSLALNPKDPPNWQALANHSKCVSDSIKKLVSSIRDKAPGQKDCDDAVEKLNIHIRDLDQASLAVISQNLPPRKDHSAKNFAEQATNCAVEITDRIDDVRNSAKSEAERLGHTVNQLVSYFEPLVNNCIGSASHLQNSKQQTILLDQTKTVTECALQLILCAKDSGGNPKATGVHGDVDESADQMKDVLSDLTKTIENVASQAGVVTGLIDTITSAIAKADSADLVDSSMSYVDYQTRMVSTVKEIARIAHEMSTKYGETASDLGQLSPSLSHHYVQLAVDCRGACASSSAAPDVAPRLRAAVQELGRSCVSAIKSASAVQSLPNDTFAHKDVSESTRSVGEKVSQVLAALQSGSRGTQACINAASTVSGIIGDLDTTILFATAGSLHSENENESFADHRENILKTAKALVEDTKTLVAGAASSQEQLASAAQNAVSTILQLSEVVKEGACSLGSNNPEAQVMLLNAVKDVASALGDLIHATKSASGKGINDPAMIYLKDSAKVMVTNVTSLLKTVKAVEDEHTRGTRALESTIEAIAQEIRAFDSNEMPKNKASAEDLMRYTKPITLATAKAVAAGNSGRQDDIIVAANVGRKSISDMLVTCKSAAFGAENRDICQRTLEAGRQTAVQYRELLVMVLQIVSRPGPNSDIKAQFPTVSKEIAHYVTNLIACAELLKGNDWEDPEDPIVVAENELIGAARSIDAAANKLSKLVPRERKNQEIDDTLSFDKMILEAAKAIAAATSALIKAASAAQRHLIDIGKVSCRPRSDSEDGQWSEGLVSAARLVAAATHSLVESANALVQGHSTEEKLISSAKQVASSTAQLLVACRVKMEESPIAHNLQAAGNAVKRATDNLVRAAQQSIAHEEENSLIVSRRMVGGIAQEIEARSEVLRVEKELAMARDKLRAIRIAKYGKGDDIDGYQSGNDSSRFETSYESSGYRTHLNTSELEQSVFGTQGAAYSSTPIHTQLRHRTNSGGSEHSIQSDYSLQPPVANGVSTLKKTPPVTPARSSGTRLSAGKRVALPQQFEPLSTPPHFITKHIEQMADSTIEEKIPSFKESVRLFSSPQQEQLDGSKLFYTSKTTVRSTHNTSASMKRFETSYQVTSSSQSSYQEQSDQ